MLRWELDAPPGAETKKRLSIRKRTNAKLDTNTEYVEVNVDTKTPIRVYIGSDVERKPLHTSKKSKLYLLTTASDNKEVLIIRWCNASFSAFDKDDVATDIINLNKVVTAPVYRLKQKFSHEGMHVSVGVRSYIEGHPLSKVIKHISAELLDHYMVQLSCIIRSMQAIQHDMFGSIIDGKLACKSASKHIATKALFEKLSGNVNMRPEVVFQLQRQQYHAAPVLCHGSLWPEHIIVQGTAILGIVGWSQADFTVEIVDRTLYLMCHERHPRYVEWTEYLSTIPTSPARANNSAVISMLDYCRALSIDRSRGKYKPYIDKVYFSIQKDLSLTPAPLSTRAPKSERDRTSLDALSDTLTDATIDTWENFTNNTVTE